MNKESSPYPYLRGRWQGYIVALALTASIVGLRFALNPVWGLEHNRHLVFIPTVMCAAWLGGFGPGVLTTALCTLALDYLWIEPPFLFHRFNSDLWLFLLVGVAISALFRSLHRARSRADVARRARERLLEIVAHDLRNPLSAARMASERARDLSHGDEGLGRALGTIDRAVARMDHMIRDLVDAAHIEHEQLEVTLRAEDAEAIVCEAVEMERPMATEREITLELVCAASGKVECDRDRILQVLSNLLGNAVKFTPRGGRVTVRTAEEGGLVRFEVEDTGPGIRPDDRLHIFERYWRSSSGGIGLGLFISQGLVRAHGGQIAVRSEPGLGASFFFSLRRPRLAGVGVEPSPL